MAEHENGRFRLNLCASSHNRAMTHHLTASEARRDTLRFVKNWTLPLAISLGTLLYLLFALTPALEAEALWFGQFFNTFLPACMFAVLFVTFCKVDFHALKIVPWHLWETVAQLIMVGFLTGLILYLHPEGDTLILLEGVLACVVCPCASAAPVVTQKLGGSLEDITSYTFLSNILTSLLIPLCFPLIAPASGLTFLPAFFLILQKVCLVLVAPMLLAFIVKHTMHRLHRIIISINDLSYYLWALSLMVVSGTTAKNIAHAGTSWSFMAWIACLSLFFCFLQYVVGRRIGHRFNCRIEAGQGLGQKNTAFAIWTAYTYLHPLSSIGPGFYILWQNLYNALEIWQCRRNGTLRSS